MLVCQASLIDRHIILAHSDSARFLFLAIYERTKEFCQCGLQCSTLLGVPVLKDVFILYSEGGSGEIRDI